MTQHEDICVLGDGKLGILIALSLASSGHFDKACQLLATNKLDLEKLVDGIYPLQRGVEAVNKAAEKGILKIQLKISS